MKRVFSLALVLLIAVSLFGCSADGNSEEASGKVTQNMNLL
jgi:hypothetical protein